MNKGLALLMLFVLAVSLFPIGAVAQEDSQDSVEALPSGPQRVIGQARSKEEYEAYSAAVQASLPDEQIQLVRFFLEQFPDSGLTAHAHKIAAMASLGVKEFDRFVEHAEKSLSELPEDPDTIPALARVYVNKGEIAKTIEMAKLGEKIWMAIEKPADMPSDKWSMKKDAALSDVHYSHGHALMLKAQEMIGDKRWVLRQAKQQFEKSLKSDPTLDFAYYRLGFVFGMLNDGENAILNLARAVSLGSDASQEASELLNRFYEFFHNGMEGLEDLIKREREYISQREAEKESNLEQLRQEQLRQEQEAQPTLPGFALPE